MKSLFTEDLIEVKYDGFRRMTALLGRQGSFGGTQSICRDCLRRLPLMVKKKEQLASEPLRSPRFEDSHLILTHRGRLHLLSLDHISQGGFTQGCNSDDLNCSGFLYCLSGDFSTTPSDTCGGVGSFCQDSTQGDVNFSDLENYLIFNQFCSSGYCNFGTGDCDTHGTTVGADCSSDPQFYCTKTSTGSALTCDPTLLTCQLAVVPSQRARSRRSELARREHVCPLGHSYCSLANGLGKECIDTSFSFFDSTGPFTF
ncbi:hypothetical protein JCM3765_000270 [Sporobolomyces pararoseus]